MEWAVGLMQCHFVDRRVFLVDGASLAVAVESGYTVATERYREKLEEKRPWLRDKMTTKQRKELRESIKWLEDGYEEYSKKALAVRTCVRERLIRLYAIPKCVPDKERKINGVIFRPFGQSLKTSLRLVLFLLNMPV
jgi:hypothetical protein